MGYFALTEGRPCVNKTLIDIPMNIKDSSVFSLGDTELLRVKINIRAHKTVSSAY